MVTWDNVIKMIGELKPGQTISADTSEGRFLVIKMNPDKYDGIKQKSEVAA